MASLPREVSLLPTPNAGNFNDGEDLDTWEARRQRNLEKGINGNGQGTPLSIAVQLLPTPSWRDTKGQSASPARHFGSGVQLPDVAIDLLPTPQARDRRSGTSRGRLHDHNGRPLPEVVSNVDWGKFEPAIRRWEAIFGAPAPVPTEPGKHGKPRLNPELPEWMMGLPSGFVTEVPGLNRQDKLRAIGNGVCPQQAAAALRLLVE